MTNPVNYNQEDVYALSRYNYGVQNSGYNAKDALTTAGLFAGGYTAWNGGKWLIQNRKDYKTAWADVKQQYNNAKQLKGNNLKESYLNNYRSQYIADLEKAYAPAKTLTQAEISKLSPSKLAAYNRSQAISAEYNKVRQLIQQSKGLTGKALLDKQKEINQALADAKLAVAKGKATPGSALAATSKTGKAIQWVKGKTGITKAELALKTSAANGGKVAKFLTKAPKGTPATAIVALALEGPEVYKTYKKLGAGAGTKQLAKSAAIAGAGVAGYALGSMALGAAVGSVVPIAGTAVGAVVGLVGGLLGAWGADTIARKLLPSELELAAQKDANEAMNNPEKMKELLEKTEKTAENETNQEVLDNLQKSYDNVYGVLSPSTEASGKTTSTNEEETTLNNNVNEDSDGTNTNNNTSKIKEALKNIIEHIKTSWNYYNPNDVYSSLKQYEKPIYPSFPPIMGTPYGYIA